jgi:thiol-disulfide isomerase/thioredoxin
MTKPIYCLALLLMLSACGEKPSGKSEAAVSNEAAQPSKNAVEVSSKTKPGLRIETFDGATFDLSEHRDKWVVVNFWATWCAPCLKEIPDFNAFAKANANVQFIGLAYEEIERADMEAFLKQHPIDYPFAILDVYNPPKDFETPRGLPMTVVLAPGGEVVKTFLGPVTSADLSAVIAGK